MAFTSTSPCTTASVRGQQSPSAGMQLPSMSTSCGRIARLRIAAQDRPGALAAITAKFFECGVNILETNHQRVFSRRPAKDTMIEVECEARDRQSIDTLVKKLEGAGFQVVRAELD